MNQYQSVEKEIHALRKPLRWYCIGGVGLNMIILLISFWVQFGQSEGRSFSSMEACYYGMDAVFNNSPSKEVVGQKVIDDLAKNKITFDVERIHLIKFIDGFHCDVVTKDPKGHRNFRVALEKNLKFKHLYKILDVKERQIESRYQR